MQVMVGFHHCPFGKSNLTSPRGLNVWSIHLVNRLERLDAKKHVRGVYLGSSLPHPPPPLFLMVVVVVVVVMPLPLPPPAPHGGSDGSGGA